MREGQVRTIYGYEIVADHDDCGVGSEPLGNKFYEREISDFIQIPLADSRTFVDVGAHVGYYSIMAAKKGCRVLAFEPESVNFGLLRRNVELNNCDGLILTFNSGLLDRYGELDLHLSADNSGGHSLKKSEISKPSGEIEKILVNRLENFYSELARPVFVKIDVQGLEWKVIEGIGFVLGYIDYFLFEKNSDNAEAMSMLTKNFKNQPVNLMGGEYVYFERL
jgi:FkbM family methyltransferase